MKFYAVSSIIYSILSLATLVHFVNTSSLVTFMLTFLFAIWSAETGIIAKIIEHNPKEDAE